MSILPSGTVTFLFTDIEGSTKLWEQHPDAMKAALARHDAILRQAIAANNGHIIKTTGDGIHAVFETAVKAAAASLAAQQALHAEAWDEISPQAVRVRMGLLTGEAELRDGDYYGSVLNRAARLMSIGHGGQILISNTTADLLRDGLPANTKLCDLGEHRLKDLVRPEHIYQLAHPSLPSEFPPIKSLDSLPNNLPVQLTSFIGREKEIAEIKGLLNAARLVTLTGSGGTGKTRLAQEVSAQELPAFTYGAWLIELAPLADPSQILPTMAQIFGLQELPSTPLAALVADYLRVIKMRCSSSITASISSRPAPTSPMTCCTNALASRSSPAAVKPWASPARWRIAFHRWRIPRRPSSSWTAPAQPIPNSYLTEANASSVAKICSRLDGIPLAIELAAARVKLLSPEQIAARLDDRFRLLIGGSRTALPRQQTLRALIDWSYDLLSEDEKRLLRTASVFVGGWTLEALEAVADDPDAMEHLEQLVNKSLVVVEEGGNAMRYSLLETIRQYAREKLLDVGVGEAVSVRNRHLDFFVKLTEAC